MAAGDEALCALAVERVSQASICSLLAAPGSTRPSAATIVGVPTIPSRSPRVMFAIDRMRTLGMRQRLVLPHRRVPRGNPIFGAPDRHGLVACRRVQGGNRHQKRIERDVGERAQIGFQTLAVWAIRIAENGEHPCAVAPDFFDCIGEWQ